MKRPLLKELERLRPAMIRAAQAVYDAWQPDEDGEDCEYGGGGICDAVAHALEGAISDSKVPMGVMDGGQDGDNHAWIVAYNNHEIYSIDISPDVYESGSGYSWQKRPDVTLDEDDLVIHPMNRKDFVNEGLEDIEDKMPLALWEDPDAKADQLVLALMENAKKGYTSTQLSEPRLLRHPNMPPKVLLAWAEHYPEEVSINPVLTLLFLQSPAMALEFKEELRNGWIHGFLPRQEAKVRRFFACEFAAHVLWIIDACGEPNEWPRKAIEAARQVAMGFAQSIPAMEEASDESAEQGRHDFNVYGAGQAAIAAAEAAGNDHKELLQILAESLFGVYFVDDAGYSAEMAAAGWAKFAALENAAAGLSADASFEIVQQAGQAAIEAERDWQAEQVKHWRNHEIKLEANRQKKHQKLKHEPTPEEKEKQAKIDAAIKQAQDSSAKIRGIMQSHETADWPVWVGLGSIAAGTIACLLIGPEILAGATIGAGLAELGVVSLTEAELGVAAEEAATQVLSISQATGIATVSLGEVEAAATLGEMISADQAAMLAQLVAKLTASGVAVTQAMAEIVVRMPK